MKTDIPGESGHSFGLGVLWAEIRFDLGRLLHSPLLFFLAFLHGLSVGGYSGSKDISSALCWLGRVRANVHYTHCVVTRLVQRVRLVN